MKLQLPTKERNQQIVVAYYILALFIVLLGIYYDEPWLYAACVVMLLLGLSRKHILAKRLHN
ncbi:MAG TPA: hypothetical protein VJB12_02155 [Candidatus Nanoarchaeia archaeon]|nr:hypothetical protein [Candidatus Nanoarchaeia archaeon]